MLTDFLYIKLDYVHWIPIITAVHDDIDASI